MVLSTTRGDNKLRRAFTTAPANVNIPYVRKEHLSLVQQCDRQYAICTALEMPVSCTFPVDCSISWWIICLDFGPRYSDTAEFHVLEWSCKCRIVAASLVLPTFWPKNRRRAGETSAAAAAPLELYIQLLCASGSDRPRPLGPPYSNGRCSHLLPKSRLNVKLHKQDNARGSVTIGGPLLAAPISRRTSERN